MNSGGRVHPRRMRPPRALRLALPWLAAAFCSGHAACAQAQPRPTPPDCPFADYPGRGTAPAVTAAGGIPRFHAISGARLSDPGADALRNADGSPRLVDPRSGRVDSAAYAAFRARMAPLLERWAADGRLAINPALVAALLAKESGFRPDALSPTGALGTAQLTAAADSDLLIISRSDSLSGWMCPEVTGWARDARYHTGSPARDRVAALLAAGELNPRGEYLLAPEPAARAAVFWLRLLETTWTGDVWPGAYGRMARDRLAGGRALDERQLLELVVASYNLGYPEVAALVERHGRRWKAQLPAETADYVERITAYTTLFQTP